MPPTHAHLAIVAVLWAAVAVAEPLDLRRVPAGAVWLMHADMDAARQSVVIDRMVDKAMKKHPQIGGMMAMAATMTGMDIRKDLHDITVYGLDTDKKNAVMIVKADANREFLERMVAKARDHETTKHRGFTLHSWTHKGWRDRGSRPVFGAFFKDDVLVFAGSADRIEMALDVLGGDADSAGADGPLAGRTRPGSILVGRASRVDPATRCPVLRQGEGFRVAIGENEGRSFYRARLDMKTAEAADLAEEVAKGLAATMALGFGEQPGVMKLVGGLETMTEGKTCTIAWDAEADEVWKMADAVSEKIEASMAARRKQWGGRKSRGAGCRCGECDSGTCPMDDKNPGKSGNSDERRPFREDEF